MSGWKAVVFDLDDTLYPEREYVLSGFRAVAAWSEAKLAIPAEAGFAQLQSLFERGVRGDTFNQWLAANKKLDGATVRQLVEVYRDHQPAISPFPAVAAVLEALKKRALLGLLSDGYLATQQRKLAALNLAHFFDAVVFSDEWGREAWKPSAIPFEMVLERLGGVPPQSAVYVADNPLKDFLGARRTGLATLQVRLQGGLYADCDPPTASHNPDMVVDSISLIPSALERLMISAP
jgi:putative hydrolase of the HAD superfamily